MEDDYQEEDNYQVVGGTKRDAVPVASLVTKTDEEDDLVVMEDMKKEVVEVVEVRVEEAEEDEEIRTGHHVMPTIKATIRQAGSWRNRRRD